MSNIKRTKEEMVNIFKERTVENHTGCWLWTGSTLASGYGQQYWGGKNWKTHRLSYWLFIKEDDSAEVIRHLCGNRRCCNPLHLSSGSVKDNVADTIAHGRSHFHNLNQDGSNNHQSSLTEAQVYEIRTLFLSEKYSVQEIGEQYGVSDSSIDRLVKGQAYGCYQKVESFNWKDLDQITFRGFITKKGVEVGYKMVDEGYTQSQIVTELGVTQMIAKRLLKKAYI